MKITTEVGKIKRALSQADKITSKNASHPILGSVLLEAKGEVLCIRSTNLSLGVEINTEAQVEKEGTIAVSGALLVNICNSLSLKDKVSLDVVGDTLSVSSGGVNLIINTLPYDEFPSIPRIEGIEFSVPVAAFLQGIKSVGYAAAVSEIKPEVSSVYIYPENGDSLVFVSTDTFRLAEKKVSVTEVPDFDGALIPFKNISEITRILSDHEEENVSVVCNKNQISFFVEGVYLTSRLIDGFFPDYRQILPKEHKTQVVVLKEDILNALRLANVFGDKFNQAKLVIDPKEGIFEISSKNSGVGENNTTLEATLSGEPISLNFNVKYLIDGFQSLFQESTVFEFTESHKPMVIKSMTDKSFLYLIMPINR
jgi:DNA polymerase-3 subunit beta